MVTTRRKCVICGVRPESRNGRCSDCNNKLNSSRSKKAASQPVKFITYRDIVVGLFPTADGRKLRGKLLRRSAERLPKSRTINLNNYCKGFTREQIKKLKAACLGLSRAS